MESITRHSMPDSVARVGLALYRETLLNGLTYYNITDLVFNHIQKGMKPSVFSRMFRRSADFWGSAEDLAKQLAESGIADRHTRPVEGERFLYDHLVRLTPFGRSLFDLAYAETLSPDAAVQGLSLEDTLLVLRDETKSLALADELAKLGPEIDALELSNFQRVTVDCYISMLTVVARMPDPDAKLFWTILNRLNAFAGVASLIVAIIALRMAK